MVSLVKFYLKNELIKYFPNQKDLFAQIMNLPGECFRQQKGRTTKRIVLGNNSYFIKQHTGVGWKEIFKNLLQGRLPILSAKNEWQALQKLQTIGIASPLVVGYGVRGLNPARLQSFVIMEDLSPMISLEEYCASWQNQTVTFALKRQLIEAVAKLAQQMHANGINHRDFYLCHFLMKQEASMPAPLYLLDLHRAAIRKQVPKRWLIKDLGGLLFSCKGIGLTTHDYYRFMKVYRKKSLRDILTTEREFWEKVKIRGHHYRDHTK